MRSCDLPSRSEIFFRPSFSAVSCVTATSLDEVNGVGGNAVMPSSANLDFASSYAAAGSLGRSFVGTSKNDSSAVPVYSG